MKKYLPILFLCCIYCLNAKPFVNHNIGVLPAVSPNIQYPNYSQEIDPYHWVSSGDSADNIVHNTIQVQNNVLSVNLEASWNYNQTFARGVVAWLDIYPALPNMELGQIYGYNDQSGYGLSGYYAKIEDNQLVIYTLTPDNWTSFTTFSLSFVIDLSCAVNWYIDSDHDGFGSATATPIFDCYQRPYYVTNNYDCNDQNPAIGIGPNWYYDTDNDGFGDFNSNPISACVKPPGNYAPNNFDTCPNVYSRTANGCPVNPPLINENYVRTINPTIPVTSVSGLAASQKIDNITYFDGLGRPMQKVGIAAGGSSEDLIAPIEYDNFGRQKKEYLPYAKSSNGGLYRNTALQDVLPIYNTPKYENTSNPYSQKDFEPSPLNRVLQMAAPGNAWSLANNHTIKLGYQTNSANEVKLFTANTNWDNAQKLFDISLYNDGSSYAKDVLYKNITKDENWTTASGKNNTTEEFKDKEGHIVLKRTYSNSDLNNDGDTADAGEKEIQHDTYYVYNVYGNLTYVLPPKAIDLIVNSTTAQSNITSSAVVTPGNTLTLSATNSVRLQAGFHAQTGSTFSAAIVSSNQNVLDNLCYQYKYDSRNRLVEKKLPGKEWEFIVYDKLDQPVLTQDVNLKAQNKWLFTKYDALSRPVYTGEYSSQVSRASLQNTVNSQTTLFESKQGINTINNTTVYYSNNAFPNTGISLYTINYYDDYSFDLNGGTTENVGTVTPSTDTKSLVTGSKIRILGTANWITNVIYYDDKGRSIYNYSKNDYLGVTQKVKTELDFVGKPNKTTTQHIKGASTITIADTFTYDSAGRLKKQTQSINGGTAEVIADNTYDDLGQLVSKAVGNKEGNPRLQTIDYTYNIRGWLKGINDSNSANNDISVGGGDLFGFKINYNNPSAGTELYNGNISQTFWKTQGQDPALKNYTYAYDALNRLTNAVSQNSGRYNENLTYDKNGNIMSLIRNGYTDPNATLLGVMDNLVYTYDAGNKLFKVKDSSGSSEGFKDGIDTAQEYTYDDNGNMKTDANKGITAITYNYLNLPVDITLSGGTVHYDYDATGVKQRKVVSGTTTDYAGGFQYENNVLKFFPQPEGYVNHNSGNFEYIYQYKDHLGNNRVSYKNVGSLTLPSLQIVEENHYYPFGFKQKIAGAVIGNTSYKYKYNGKEFQDELGLNIYDYEARNYDPVLGRFMNLDPMAEKRNWLSPYNYVQNNPILKIDPDGMLDGDYYTNDGDWLGNDGIDDKKVHVVNDGDYKAIGGGKTNIYKSTELTGVTNEILLAFASVIHAESGGSKNESYAIGNVTMNFIDGGGSRQIPTLEDAVMYDNKFAQGATQDNLTSFMGLGDKNSKFAMGAAINALGKSQGISGFSDYSGGANGWDGIDLISTKWENSHRDYSWSEGSKELLKTYKKDNNGGVDVSAFTYKKSGYQISATKIIGNSIYTKLTTGRGEKKQSDTRFHL